MELDLNKISNIKFDGIDHSDHPDYVDAYITSADYDDRELTDEELEKINDDRDYVYEKLMSHLY